jgi:hypothetical protein
MTFVLILVLSKNGFSWCLATDTLPPPPAITISSRHHHHHRERSGGTEWPR